MHLLPTVHFAKRGLLICKTLAGRRGDSQPQFAPRMQKKTYDL
jgi:hypothetical protein